MCAAVKRDNSDRDSEQNKIEKLKIHNPRTKFGVIVVTRINGIGGNVH